MNSMLMTRWLLVALSAAIAVVLLVHGNVVLGVLLGAIVVTRAAMLSRMQRRRERFRRRIAARRARRAGVGPGAL